MKLSAEQIAETIDSARGFLVDQDSPMYADKGLSFDFAAALVQVAGTCAVGLPCEKHYGSIHGREAEELRAGVEQILRITSDASDLYEDGALHDLREMRRALIALFDRVDGATASRSAKRPIRPTPPPPTSVARSNVSRAASFFASRAREPTRRTQMAQPQTNTNTQNTNNGTPGNGSAAPTKQPKAMTAVDAIKKIGTILDQLSPNDKKRVLAFVNDENQASE